jgi:hypothetical protein
VILELDCETLAIELGLLLVDVTMVTPVLC